MKTLQKIIFIFILFINSFGSTQSIRHEKNIVKKLTSKSFYGRGYVNNGMNKSADFVAKKFKQNNLKSFQGNYFQVFDFPINVIENAELTLNDKKLIYGTDFIVNPNSKSINYPTIDSEKNDLILTFDSTKLISSLSQEQALKAEFFIHNKFSSDNLKINQAKIESSLKSKFEAKNIIGYIEGENTDSLVVVTAHYDHLGMVGQHLFPGANDNASGLAMLLGLAKYYKKNKPKNTLVFIAFAAEEAGLLGSDYFVHHPLFDLKKIKFLINLDILGTGDDGIQVVNSTIFKNEYSLLNSINQNKKYLPQIKTRGEACNSDHCPFYSLGIKSFYIYTLGGKSYYHDTKDDYKSLTFKKFKDIKQLLIDFIKVI